MIDLRAILIYSFNSRVNGFTGQYLSNAAEASSTPMLVTYDVPCGISPDNLFPVEAQRLSIDAVETLLNLFDGLLGRRTPVPVRNLGGEEHDLQLVADEVVEHLPDSLHFLAAHPTLQRTDGKKDRTVQNANRNCGDGSRLPRRNVAKEYEDNSNQEDPDGRQDQFPGIRARAAWFTKYIATAMGLSRLSRWCCLAARSHLLTFRHGRSQDRPRGHGRLLRLGRAARRSQSARQTGRGRVARQPLGCLRRVV